jgi:DNA-binding CsgD family transcriptional regulator
MEQSGFTRAALIILHDDILLHRSTAGAGGHDTLPPSLAHLPMLALVGEQWVIGRDASCELRVRERRKGVSRRHATIQRNGDLFVLTDQSTYGTYVNGRQILHSSLVLQHGDLIGLATPQELLRFDEVPADWAAPALTEREFEVLRMLAAGLLNKEIAGALSISPTTVNSHLKSIFEKLNAHTRTEAVRNARHLRLI